RRIPSPILETLMFVRSCTQTFYFRLNKLNTLLKRIGTIAWNLCKIGCVDKAFKQVQEILVRAINQVPCYL
mgnify:CR=1